MDEGPKIVPKWKDVLLAIYQGKATGEEFGPGKGGIADDHPLAKKLKISGWELTNSLSFLEEQHLVAKYGAEIKWITLTEKGFDVAVKIDGERSATRTQSLLVVVTLLLAVTGAFQFFAGTGRYDPNLLLVAYAGALTILLLAIWGRHI